MQLKTVSSIGLAFLLVFGVVGVASAQVDVASPPGIFIRVDAPKANEWVAIGDTIRVRILCYEGRLSTMVSSLRWSIPALKTMKSEPPANIATKIYFNFDENDSRVRAGGRREFRR